MTETARVTHGGVWTLLSKKMPEVHRNVLLAFESHWNPVVGFYCGKKQIISRAGCRDGNDYFYETSANDHNSEIVGEQPKWWTEIPEVPHHP